MLRLADVLRRHAPDYMARHGGAMLPSHRRAIQAIIDCRTPARGAHVAACDPCGHAHIFYHSCQNRACPQCGHASTTRWIAQQRDLLLPVQYFHVVFTLPAELRRIVRSHQKELIPVLFRAAFDALAALCADDHYLGAQVGALAVLHTWTRTLEWHPHIHMLVPGGGLGPDGRTWVSLPRRIRRFLVPVKALAKLFRGRFLDLARKAIPAVSFPVIPWKKSWVVFSKPTVQGADKVIEYLGRYVHRTAIADKAIIACDERTVTFRYRDGRLHDQRTMKLPAHEFLRRFLQHVPAKGLHRVRSFGFLHPANRGTLRRLQLLLATSARPANEGPAEAARRPLRCPRCGSAGLRLIRRLTRAECRELERIDRSWATRARAPPPTPSATA